jgi:hypothetical protein
MSKSKYVEEILEATKDQVKGFDNSRLILAILNKFEAGIRLDQCDKDEEMVMNILNKNKDESNS